MKCRNCGSEIREGALFCGICGTKTGVDDIPQQQGQQNQYDPSMQQGQYDPYMQQGQQNQYDPYMQQGQQGQFVAPQMQDTQKQGGEPPKKKKKIGKVVKIACVAAVLVLGAGTAALAAPKYISNFVHETFSSSEDYFKYVLKQNTKTNLSAFSDSYGKCVDTIKGTDSGADSNVKIEVSSIKNVTPLLSSVLSLTSADSFDLSSLDNVSLELTSSTQGDERNMELVAGINDETVATIRASLDLENETGYLQIPELSEGYIDCSEAVTQINNQLEQSVSQSNKSIDELEDMIPSAKTVTNILTTYTDIIYDDVTDVKKSSETISASGVEQKYTALTAELGGKYAYQVLSDALNKLSKDDDVKEVITSIDDGAAYREFLNNLESLASELEDNKEEFQNLDLNLELTLYVDSKAEIVGEDLNFVYEDESMSVSCLMPQKGSKFGYLLQTTVSGRDLYEMEGEGTIKHNIMNGTFDVSINNELLTTSQISSGNSILTMEVSDFNMKDAKKGNLNGSFKFSTKAIPAISGYSLLVETSSTSKKSTVAVALLSGEMEMIRFTLSSAEGKKVSAIHPSASDSVYSIADSDQIWEYLYSMDFNSFVNNISKASGFSISEGDMEDALDDIFWSLRQLIW